MKKLIGFPLLLFWILFLLQSCKHAKPVEESTTTEQTTTSDTIPAALQTVNVDSSNMNPETVETATEKDSPKPAPITTGSCAPGFITLANPSKDHHIFQVTGFEPGNNKCWDEMWKHSIQICSDHPACEIIYVDVSKITKTSTPPYHLDAAQLQQHGIGLFTSQNALKQLQGARIWGRKGKAYDYYYTPI